jgi:hypothetical protein
VKKIQKSRVTKGGGKKRPVHNVKLLSMNHGRLHMRTDENEDNGFERLRYKSPNGLVHGVRAYDESGGNDPIELKCCTLEECPCPSASIMAHNNAIIKNLEANAKKNVNCLLCLGTKD